VSGAAGQLHKSTYNKRVQGTAQKPRRPWHASLSL
jgi:hypothetical protein